VHFPDSTLNKNFYSRGSALGFEQVDDFLRRAVAEELTERFFVVRNAVLFDQRDEVDRRVAGQRGFREVFVRGNEILWLAMDIREITTPATRDQDFLADAIGMLQNGDTPPAFAGLNGAKKSRSAGAENQSVKLTRQEQVSLEPK
jgi:hypothetical protein